MTSPTHIDIRGTAHPPPPASGKRGCVADLSRAEIGATNIAGRPLLEEHQHDKRVGECLASWQGTDGSLRVAARVTDPVAIEKVRDGTLRGLSLGTDMVMNETGDVLYRAQGELSICEEGRRAGTWIDTVNGKTVHRVACASAQRAKRERDNMVSQLKEQLAEQTEKAAQASQQLEYFNKRERERISAYQPDSAYFFNDFMKEEIEKYHEGTSLATDVAPLGVWANEFVNKKDITSQGALAAASYVASKAVKRYRDEASKLPSIQESLAASLKENEELKQGKDKLQRDYDEAIGLANERQKGLEVLQEKLAQAGLVGEKFDFSKLTSREADAPKVAEPHATTTPVALEAVKAEASKAAAGNNARANPLESADLLQTLLARSNAGLRVTNSGTQHAFLGAASGEVNLAATIAAASGY